MEIQIGDIVTWRHGKSAAMKSPEEQRHVPLGICGCEVLELGAAENGEPAAKLRLPEFFAGLSDDATNGYVADLEKD